MWKRGARWHMATKINRLTPVAIKNAKPGRHGDGGSLYLLVKPDGRKTWTFRYRDRLTGKLRDKGLGPTWDVGLPEARERAAQLRRQLRDGIDPIDSANQAKLKARTEHAKRVTFGWCAAQYIEVHKAGWSNPKHAAQWDSTLRTYCAPLWPLDVAAVDTGLVMRCLEPIWQTKTETASRLRGRIESVLAWATVRKYRSGDNPAAWRNHLDQLLPKRSKVQKVEHRPALPYAGIAEFMAQLRQRQGLAARVLELQILTATRPGEAAGAQWEEIDLEAAMWIIPGERMKAGKEHRIPLSDAAVKLLRSLLPVLKGKPVTPTGNVFPGVRGKPITTDAGMALLKEMQPGITAHGFRSTFRDWAGETTAHPREVVEAALAHHLKDKAEAAYARGTLLQRRKVLMDDWAGYCATIRKGDNVTLMKKRKAS